MPNYPKNIDTRFFFDNSTIDGKGCWIWNRSVISKEKPYGVLGHKGKTCRAHRLCWVVTYGEIPEGLFVCHMCNEKQCVNPAHLYLGTPSQNTKDAYRDGLRKPKLTSSQVEEIRRLYIPPTLGNSKELAERFGVDRSSIIRVVNRMADELEAGK